MREWDEWLKTKPQGTVKFYVAVDGMTWWRPEEYRPGSENDLVRYMVDMYARMERTRENGDDIEHYAAAVQTADRIADDVQRASPVVLWRYATKEECRKPYVMRNFDLKEDWRDTPLGPQQVWIGLGERGKSPEDFGT